MSLSHPITHISTNQTLKYASYNARTTLNTTCDLKQTGTKLSHIIASGTVFIFVQLAEALHAMPIPRQCFISELYKAMLHCGGG